MKNLRGVVVSSLTLWCIPDLHLVAFSSSASQRLVLSLSSPLSCIFLQNSPMSKCFPLATIVESIYVAREVTSLLCIYIICMVCMYLIYLRPATSNSFGRTGRLDLDLWSNGSPGSRALLADFTPTSQQEVPRASSIAATRRRDVHS